MEGRRERGEATAIYLPKGLYRLSEETRKKLGMSRSRFYQYCVTKVLQELNVLSSTVHEKEVEKDG